MKVIRTYVRGRIHLTLIAWNRFWPVWCRCLTWWWRSLRQALFTIRLYTCLYFSREYKLILIFVFVEGQIILKLHLFKKVNSFLQHLLVLLLCLFIYRRDHSCKWNLLEYHPNRARTSAAKEKQTFNDDEPSNHAPTLYQVELVLHIPHNYNSRLIVNLVFR